MVRAEVREYRLREQYFALRDGTIDAAAGRGVGVNGLNLDECSIDDARRQLRHSSPFQWKRPPVIVFRHTGPSRRYRVIVNGAEAGSWRGEDLEKGIPLSTAAR
jgi:hypothetical protein